MNLEFKENQKITVIFDKTVSHNVDPQNGFTPLCPNELPVPDGHFIVDELNNQNNLVKYKTVSKDIHPNNSIWIATKEKPQFSKIEGDNVDIRWNSHCISGTFGSQLLNGLPKITEYDFFVSKGFEPDVHPYSSCYHDISKKISTGLIEWYKDKDISTIIVGGLATDYCVGETVIDLSNAGFQVILNLNACRGIGNIKEIDDYINMLIDEYNVIVIDSYKDIDVIY